MTRSFPEFYPEKLLIRLSVETVNETLTLGFGAINMETLLINLPDRMKGDWCDTVLAKQAEESITPETAEEIDYHFLKGQWAKDLLIGDLKAAHKSWGKWQGFAGGDPWEDIGWRNFLELQRFGEALWKDFDASRFRDFVWLRTYISYWPGTE